MVVATVVVVVEAPATVVVALVVVVVAPATVVVGLAVVVVVVVVVPPSREAPVVLKVNASKCRGKMQLPGIILEKQNEGKWRQSCLFIFMETVCLAIIKKINSKDWNIFSIVQDKGDNEASH